MGIIYTKKEMDEIRKADICLGDLVILQNGKIYLATEYSLMHPINQSVHYDCFDYKGRLRYGYVTSRTAKPILKIIHKDDKNYESAFQEIPKWRRSEN